MAAPVLMNTSKQSYSFLIPFDLHLPNNLYICQIYWAEKQNCTEANSGSPLESD